MNPIEFLAHPYTVVLARWLLAGILLVAGISKLFDREGFVQAVEAYQILPARLSRMFALILPYLEITVAFFLLIGLATRLVAVLAILLFITFIITLGINLLRGKDLDCHCFGKLYQEKIGLATLSRNFILMLLAALVLTFADGYLAIDSWLLGANTSNAPPVAGLIPITLTSVAAFFAYLLVQQVWAMTHTQEL